MLELLILITLSRRIARITKSKGRSAAAWILLLIGLWIVGEIGGLFLGAIASMIVSGDEEPNVLAAIVGALLGVTTAAVFTFSILKRLPSLLPEEASWQLPESDDYREKFDLDRYQARTDADKYRAQTEGDIVPRPPDDTAFRPPSEEE
jgi:hypothetical protein